MYVTGDGWTGEYDWWIEKRDLWDGSLSSSSFVAGEMVENLSQQTNSISLSVNEFTEIEFNFQFMSYAGNETPYCFRVRNNGSADLDDYIKVATIITAAPPITVSGHAYHDEGITPIDGSSTNKTVQLRVNGLGSYTYVINTDDGAWEITDVAAVSGNIITVYLDDEDEEATTVYVSDGTNKADVDLYKNRVIVRADTGSITNDNLSTGDDMDDDIKYSVTDSNLTVDSGFKLIVWTSSTFAPGGTIGFGTANSNNDLLVRSGATLNGTNDVTVNGGDVTGEGTISLTNGTFTLSETGSFGGSTADWTFYNLTFSGTTTATGTNQITISNVLTIDASDSLDADSKTWTLSGSDTPFIKTGTLTPSASTVVYSGSSATNVTSTTYNNLNIGGSGTTATYTAVGDITVNSVLTIVESTGTNEFNASNRTITLAGSGTPFIINASEVFTYSTSTVKYTGGSDTYITATEYYDLNLVP